MIPSPRTSLRRPRPSGRRGLAATVATFSLAIGGLAVTAPATAASASPARTTRASAPPPKVSPAALKAAGLKADANITADKAASTREVTSDPALLKATGTKLVPVVVKFDYDAIAAYRGQLKGRPATSPMVTDKALDANTATKSSYARYVAGREATIVNRITAAVPKARIGVRLRVVYGGVAMQVPAGQVRDLLKIEGVVAVQKDAVNKPLTDSSTTFIGAPSIWDQTGGQAHAGNGLLFGSLDTGVWPEHPSFADDGTTPTAPTDNDGHPLVCNFGDNPLTPANDPFVCNNKLVGGMPFLDTYDEINDPPTYDGTARDSDGHGTHTSSTAAGDVVDHATVLGVDRGRISGVAPGAWVMSYRVCGPAGCYESDSAAATEHAILDGVDVINFSIGGGTSPSADPAELSFLDAYAAGVFVATSAGNDGPTASTVNHVSPWVTSVAASTQSREFDSTLTLTADDDETYRVDGASITAGVTDSTPVEFATDVSGYTDPFCGDAPTSDTAFAGHLVICERGNDVARVTKGYNLHLGGAVGMILYNPTLEDTETDNHWLPAIHIADGTDLLAFMSGHTGVTGTFTAGTAKAGTGDVLAAFSSRGPGGLQIKPDIAAPGVQILAGNTPTPEATDLGPAGEYFQAIAGTSMASPHIAGSALLIKALHPDWSPGEVKSALMTTAKTDLVEEDETTPVNPFDVGSGRVQLAPAGDPGLVLDETADRLGALGVDPLHAVDLNEPSIDAPRMPGRLVTTRTFTNVDDTSATYTVTGTAGPGSTITADPSTFTIAPGATQAVQITIASSNDSGDQEFGSVDLTADGRNPLHLPVAFVAVPGDVTITPTGCDPAAISAFDHSTCSFQVDNLSTTDSTVDLSATSDDVAQISSAGLGATVTGNSASASGVELGGGQLGVPSIAGNGSGGYLALSNFGIDPSPIGDEEMQNYTIPAFTYNGRTYDTIGVDSNGYLVVGGGTSQDNDPTPQDMPNAAAPNDVLAPFWTDLDGTGASGVTVGVLSDNDTGDTWTVVEWDVNVYGTTTPETFQVWLGANGVQDITFDYDPDHLPVDPNGNPFIVGAENADGTGGATLGSDTLPTEDQIITSTDPTPGASLTWNLGLDGTAPGTADVHAEASSPILSGTDLADDSLIVTALPAPVIWTQPADVATFAGNDVTFSASAKGARSVQWQVSTDAGGTWTDVEGADAPAYHFVAERDQDGNQYRATFQNGTGGSVTTDVAHLSVRYADPEGFVRKLYLAVLGRAADPGGLAHWVAVVKRTDAGGTPRSVIAEVFSLSPEARRHFVDQAYQAILGRAADPNGRAYWTNRVQHGLTGDDLYATLAASSAGYQHEGGTSGQAVQAYYQLWLDRAGDPGGVAHWTAKVDADNTPSGRRRVGLFAFARTLGAARTAASRALQTACDGSVVPMTSTVMGILAGRYERTRGDLPSVEATAVALGCQIDA